MTVSVPKSSYRLQNEPRILLKTIIKAWMWPTVLEVDMFDLCYSDNYKSVSMSYLWEDAAQRCQL